jgi:hypothetical protein
MASLFTYLKQTQRFIRDSRQELVDPNDLIDYINQARRETAMRAAAIRVLPPISGAVTQIVISSGGTDYGSPVVTISDPDSPSGYRPYPNGKQATAIAEQISGVITSINVSFGGAGYFQPIVTITDADDTGSGAAAYAITTINNTLNEGQEVYPFSGIDLSPFPGVESIYLVRGVSIIYSNYRYSLPQYSFSVYQAMIRQYVASQYQYVPTFCSQFGQGTSGSLYLYPPPSQQYQLEWDCQCLPSDLTTDQDYEPLPDPWTDAVPFYAAYLAMIELQNWNSARTFEAEFEKRLQVRQRATRPGRLSNPYGRW